jgi:hypothetical protein
MFFYNLVVSVQTNKPMILSVYLLANLAAFHGYGTYTQAKLSRLILHLVFRRGGAANRQMSVYLYFLKQLLQLIFPFPNSIKNIKF